MKSCIQTSFEIDWAILCVNITDSSKYFKEDKQTYLFLQCWARGSNPFVIRLTVLVYFVFNERYVYVFHIFANQ